MFSHYPSTDGAYSRKWAAKLDVPILSIDYSLAPEFPFPCALVEIFYVYCWALKNAELVGSTGENIVFVGDSAGANLTLACIIKCIEMGIKKPKGILTIYGALALNYVTTPARYLGLMDVVLPYKVHMRMFGAYIGRDDRFDKNITKNGQIPKSSGKEFDMKFPNDPLLSPSCTPRELLKQFPPTVVLSTNFDSCLDECVEFAKSLKRAGAPVKLDILKNLNHGFLNFSPVNTTTTTFKHEKFDFRLPSADIT